MKNCNCIVSEIEKVIADRQLQQPGHRSYTVQLLSGGTAAVSAKLLEEVAEVVDAGTVGNRSQVISESADLLFHLLIFLALCDADFQDVLVELERRFGVSGIDEKESRQK